LGSGGGGEARDKDPGIPFDFAQGKLPWAGMYNPFGVRRGERRPKLQLRLGLEMPNDDPYPHGPGRPRPKGKFKG